jgi:hypothetical protein
VPVAEIGREYLNDPQTEDCVYGDELREGDVAILAEGLFRWHSGENTFNPATHWCRVTKLRQRGDILSFIGVYADGSQVPRTYNVSLCWYIKREEEDVA